MPEQEFQKEVLEKLEIIKEKQNELDRKVGLADQKLCMICDQHKHHQSWLEGHERELAGDVNSKGLRTRMDSVESTAERHEWYLKTAIGTALTSLIAGIVTFFKGD